MVGNIDERSPKPESSKLKARRFAFLILTSYSYSLKPDDLTVRVVSPTKLFGIPPLKLPARLVNWNSDWTRAVNSLDTAVMQSASQNQDGSRSPNGFAEMKTTK